MFALRLAPDLTERIDAFAKANGEASRSEAMRRLLELGLERAPRKPADLPPLMGRKTAPALRKR